jgi:MFS family permease
VVEVPAPVPFDGPLDGPVDVPIDVPAGAPPGAPAHATRFEALRFPRYRVLFVSSTLMFFAIQAQQIARGWLAIELTGSNAGLGGVFMAFGVPMLFMSPVGGVLADRFPKKAVLTACQTTILVAALMIAVADGVGILEYWMLLLASAVHGAGLSVMGPTRMAFTGEVVGRTVLPNAVVLQQMGMNGTRVIGPAIAGALIGIPAIGAGGVYVVTSAIIVVAIWFTFQLPDVPVRGRGGVGSPFSELVDGLRYVRSRPQVLLLIMAFSVVVIVGFPYLAFLPFIAQDIFDVGSTGYGVMSTVSAAAAVIATFWLAARVSRGSVWRLQALCGLGFSVGLVLLAVSPTYGIALVVLFFVGAATAGFQAMNSSLVLTETELEYHGRMQSLLMTGFAVSAIVALPLGFVADAIGLRETLAAMGVICVVAMLAYVVARRRYVARENLPF